MARTIDRPPQEPVQDTPRWRDFFSLVSDNVFLVEVVEESLTPSTVAANTVAEQTFTITGLTTDDFIVGLAPPGNVANIGICGHRISLANTLAITFFNNNGAPLAPPSGTYKIFRIIG
jgi:hypothetical protein